MLTLDEKTYEQISNLIEYMYKNGDEIKKYIIFHVHKVHQYM